MCRQGSHLPGTKGSGGPGGAPTPGSAPLFNTQVQPYASFTGPYDYIAKGAALRDQGYGIVNLTWPGGASSLVAAYMIWAILNDSAPPLNATLNGNPVAGTWTAYATPSPCWAPVYIYTIIADVTSAIVNGKNNITGVPSGDTSGGDPWSVSQTNLLDEGASLVAIYDTGGSTIHQVTVLTGALPVQGAGPIATLNYSTTNSTKAKTTYIVADGQLPTNSAVWNGTTVDPNAFPGSDPHESPATWSYGNLSDTRTYDVNVSKGSTNVTAEVSTSGSDCVNWVGQVLSVGVPALRGPYAVTFTEQGLVGGTHWGLRTNGTNYTSVAGAAPTAINLTLNNGSYAYRVGRIAGYVTTPSHGNYSVAGGPVFIRLIFHQVVYPVVFNETGLPNGTSVWYTTLTNLSQGLSDVGSAYAPAGTEYAVGNGTYNFTATTAGLYRAVPANGSVTVNGTGVTRVIHFEPPPLYNVTFVERNLTAGTRWGGNVFSNWKTYSNSTPNASFTVQLPNATVGYDSIYPAAVHGYTPAYSISFAVSGQAETIDVNYSLLYSVWFNSTGLPPSASWTVYLTHSFSSQYGYTTNGSVYFGAANGTYTFTVTPPWAYVPSPVSGSVTVAGANVTVHIAFSLAATYVLTFTESGLVPGTPWSIEVMLPNTTHVYHNSTSGQIIFSEPNGSYYYVPTASGYQATPLSSYLYVSGASVNESVVFTKVFAVTFTELGLPSGSFWEIEFDYSYGYTYGPTITFEVQNGTYSFYSVNEGTFLASPVNGSIVISGAGASETIVYASSAYPTYSVTFSENGLPVGTNWSVQLAGWTERTVASTLVFTEANGSFLFSVGTVNGYTGAPSSGTVNVTGAPATQTVDFSTGTSTYLATFTETGLPDGSTWFINITGQSSLFATVSGAAGTTVSLSLPDGSYSYTVATSTAGWTASSPNSFTVAGAPVGVSVPFTSASVARYTATFTETGLPSGAIWFVNITGEPSLSATVSGSAGTSLTIQLPNGTYTFSAATDKRGYTNSAGPSFTVNGAPVGVPVGFKAPSAAQTKYTVTFTETGLPNGASWFLNITGETPLTATVSATGGTQLALTLANGSFTYAAHSGLKNWTTSASANFQVSGANVALTVAFNHTAPTTTSPVSSSSTPGVPYTWIAVGLALVAAVLLLFFAFMARRRKKQRAQPPPGPPTGPGVPPSG